MRIINVFILICASDGISDALMRVSLRNGSEKLMERFENAKYFVYIISFQASVKGHPRRFV